ncbi:hypothetical protein WJX84_008664 [Apatococcus fuscideae]|uniref:Glycosyl transferase CAP10 domain-containing protein n=1 Tax=Apatococcus fuscideae TaxID=2026836 RepID=A0AAW1T8P4_9CHLO
MLLIATSMKVQPGGVADTAEITTGKGTASAGQQSGKGAKASLHPDASSSKPLHTRLNASNPDLDLLFSQIYRDLEPYRESGITLEMVEQVYCMFNTQSFRVQVLDGRMYIAGETQGFGDIQDRMKKLLAHVWSRYAKQLPDVDMMIQFDDWMLPNLKGKHHLGHCLRQGPVITASKTASDWHGLLAPDSGYMDEPGWDLTRELLDDSVAHQPWENRTAKLLFRGAPNGNREYQLGPDLEALRDDELDIALLTWQEDDKDYMSQTQTCGYKYLLYMPGNTWAGRLKYLLSCAATVIMPQDHYVAFWWHLLQDGKHVVKIDALRGGNSADPVLRGIVSALKQNDTAAQAIGANARSLVRNVLHPENLYEYWYRLICAYAELQRFEPSLHPDALPLAESILRIPSYKHIRFRDRTCTVCQQAPNGSAWRSGWMKSADSDPVLEP